MAAALVALLCLGASGCGTGRGSGPYEIAGGSTPGVYYNYGDQLANALHRDLGIDVSVAETQGSVDNLLRVASGEALAGFAQGDTAADAVAGTGAFSEPLPVQAVARVYDEYVHLVVPDDSEVRSVEDLAGHTVSLGSESSGVQVIATRVLESSGVPIAEVSNPALGLGDSIEAMRDGELEAFFWVGGVPTPGIEGLAEQMPIRLISIDSDTVERVNDSHAGVYRLAEFPIGAYGSEASAVTMTVPNYLVASADTPSELIYDVTRVLFESRSAIAQKVHAAEFLDRRQAIFTAPMELHPGAAKYYLDARR